MFEKILIANRGEIALRVIRACKEMGISTVAIHSTADSEAMHVKLADESVCVGPPAASASYLNIPAIIAACEITGAEAIHPGYGFLSENARFADIVKEHGLTFIGPTPDHIRMMGDKITAKQTVKALGIPTVPGSDGEVSDADSARVAEEIGYPVLIKATAGGGGRGMKVAQTAAELSFALSQARTEAKAAFGNDTVYMEKYLQKPRHIEIQILADSHGHVVHLGERDCSLQRRHQKVWEEAGSPALNAQERDEIGGICTTALEKLGYLGAGTIEFLYRGWPLLFHRDEHPPAGGASGHAKPSPASTLCANRSASPPAAPLGFDAKGYRVRGPCHRMPHQCGKPLHLPPLARHHRRSSIPPAAWACASIPRSIPAISIPPYYDSLAGKLIVHARNRNECLLRLRRALDELVVGGIETTIPLFQKLVREPDIINGDYSIHWLEKYLASLGHQQ